MRSMTLAANVFSRLRCCTGDNAIHEDEVDGFRANQRGELGNIAFAEVSSGQICVRGAFVPRQFQGRLRGQALASKRRASCVRPRAALTDPPARFLARAAIEIRADHQGPGTRLVSRPRRLWSGRPSVPIFSVRKGADGKLHMPRSKCPPRWRWRVALIGFPGCSNKSIAEETVPALPRSSYGPAGPASSPGSNILIGWPGMIVDMACL